MPDTTTAPADLATRIARALGIGVSDLVVLVGDADRAAAAKPGRLSLFTGSEGAPPREIVVPLDGTAVSEAILPFAVRISLAENLPIRILVPRGKTYGPTDSPIGTYLKVLVNTMREQHVSVTGSECEGDPLHSALQAARGKEAFVAFASADPVSRLGPEPPSAPVLMFSPR